MEEKIMFLKIIAMIVSALILGAGLYYLAKEKNDRESRKIYGIAALIGGVLFLGALLLTVLSV